MTTQADPNWQLKTEREQLITQRDALKLDLDAGYLSNTERLETAQKMDRLNEQIKVQ